MTPRAGDRGGILAAMSRRASQPQAAPSIPQDLWQPSVDLKFPTSLQALASRGGPDLLTGAVSHGAEVAANPARPHDRDLHLLRFSMGDRSVGCFRIRMWKKPSSPLCSSSMARISQWFPKILAKSRLTKK